MRIIRPTKSQSLFRPSSHLCRTGRALAYQLHVRSFDFHAKSKRSPTTGSLRTGNPGRCSSHQQERHLRHTVKHASRQNVERSERGCRVAPAGIKPTMASRPKRHFVPGMRNKPSSKGSNGQGCVRLRPVRLCGGFPGDSREMVL